MRVAGWLGEPAPGFVALQQTHLLPDCSLGLLVDTGAWDNCAGDEWVRSVADRALAAHEASDIGEEHKPSSTKSRKPLHLRGIGGVSQSCEWDVELPVALPRGDGSYSLDRFSTPVIPQSTVPGILGMKSMKNRRVILDLTTNMLHMLGPGNANIELPPGSQTLRMKQCPSGHLLLPISEYQAFKAYESARDRLQEAPAAMQLPVLETMSAGQPAATSRAASTETPPGLAASSSSNTWR